ncbi:hypothetical protein NL108_015966 [Boleophthalmus pectinirostris]|uniref:E3 ubiquitin-protein ligase TRIM47-like n=1 Tax=Boleophthalmus pectinirostris TaxID=150288 RepID=UPI0024332DF9|nr:E3 ubiquitin-protein ligase TRIM47-like [Boleophthalmus pectinirostris]KAJ0051192.1 hypothetical protein NL108_015966 [Boleophthalmus pectinirostris]
MSGASLSLEEHLSCPICLDLLSDPVSTPCEHSFCRTCLVSHWDRSSECSCPLCQRRFTARPHLRANPLLHQVLCQVKKQTQKQEQPETRPSEPQESKAQVQSESTSTKNMSSSSEVKNMSSSSEVKNMSSSSEVKNTSSSSSEVKNTSSSSSSSEVQCDVCSEPKLKALKSCLVCLSSFCESHLQPHLTVSGLKRHQLMEPVENLEDRMCPTHQRPLELFCSTDEKSVCMMCSLLEHKNHEFLPLKDAFEEQKVSLEKSLSENRRKVLNRRQKMEQIRAALEQSQTQAQAQTEEMVEVFSQVVEKVQSCLDRHSEIIEKTLSKHEERAQMLLSRLEREILELEKSGAEAERLSRSRDPLHFLQHLAALAPPAGLEDWSGVSFEAAAFEGTVARALAAFTNALSDTQRQVQEAELRRVRRSGVDVTLDPDTAHCKLVLSRDNKKVHYSDGKKKNPEKVHAGARGRGLKEPPRIDHDRLENRESPTEKIKKFHQKNTDPLRFRQ